jgi:succinate dehydrogenase / fumarate reductase, membrane anchor subunit
MSLRTPLGAALGRGAARGGVHHWWMQRVTAVALIPLTAWLLASFLCLPLADYAVVTAWIAVGWHPVWLSLTVLVMAWHSQLGVQVVIEDYVHGNATKTAALLAVKFAHVLIAAAGVYAVLRIAFRSV